jgi:hypothetical protein
MIETYIILGGMTKMERRSREKNNTVQIQHTYRKMIKMTIFSPPIRLAMMGGLHRCGLATHLLTNAYIWNARPELQKDGEYTITQETSLNVDVPLHIIVPKEDTLRNSFVRVCAEYSKNIQEGKTQSFTTTKKTTNV